MKAALVCGGLVFAYLALSYVLLVTLGGNDSD